MYKIIDGEREHKIWWSRVDSELNIREKDKNKVKISG